MSKAEPTRMVLIVVNRQSAADRIVERNKITADWRWFSHRTIALNWLDDCAQKGVPIDPTWIF